VETEPACPSHTRVQKLQSVLFWCQKMSPTTSPVVLCPILTLACAVSLPSLCDVPQSNAFPVHTTDKATSLCSGFVNFFDFNYTAYDTDI